MKLVNRSVYEYYSEIMSTLANSTRIVVSASFCRVYIEVYLKMASNRLNTESTRSGIMLQSVSMAATMGDASPSILLTRVPIAVSAVGFGLRLSN